MDSGLILDITDLSCLRLGPLLEDGLLNMQLLRMLSWESWSMKQLSDLENIIDALNALVASLPAKSK